MKADVAYKNLILMFDKTPDDLRRDIPNRKPYLGISYPQLNQFSKELYKGDFIEFLQSNSFNIYELEILQTYLIGKIKEPNLAIKFFRDFVPHAREWSVVDSLCQKFVISKKAPDLVFEIVKDTAATDDEYQQRIAAVLILSHFFTDTYVNSSIEVLNQLRHEGYFTKMAVAWAVATLMVKFPRKAFDLLESERLDPWTQNKAISKIHDSKRISDSFKAKAKLLRR